MHSSGMCTICCSGHLRGRECLPRERECLPRERECPPRERECLPRERECLPRRVSVQEGMSAWEEKERCLTRIGVFLREVCLGASPGEGIVSLGGVHLSPPGQTDTCENITFPTTTVADGKKLQHRNTQNIID